MIKHFNKLIILLLCFGYLFFAFKPADSDKHLARATEIGGKPVFVNCVPVTPYDVAFNIEIKVSGKGFGCPNVLDIANALVKHAEKQGLPYDAIIMGSGKIDLAIKFK